MSPPTEQLIRDYLNRLSVAARGRLGPDDRRALTARTHDFIERQTGLAGPPTAVEVAQLLAGLGDPGGLVDQEVRRLAVLRGEEAPERPARDGFLDRVLHRDATTPVSWHWPPQPGSRADWQLRLMDPATGPEQGIGNQAGSPAASPAAEPSVQIPAQPGPQDRPGPRLTIVPQPSESEPAGASGPDPAGAERGPEPAGAEAGPEPAGAEAGPEPDRSERGPEPARSERGPESAGAGLGSPGGPDARPRLDVASWVRAVVAWARAMPLEASAVVLLGVGGAIFPPVWLAGAALALVSRVWHYRDKWVGLAVPVLLTVIGTAAGLAAAGNGGTMGYHLHVAWVFAVAVSRVSAALGAAYLAWWSVHDKKEPEVPPWEKPRRIS